MKTVRLALKKHSYEILVGSGLLPAFGKHLKRINIGRDAYVVTNRRIHKRYSGALERSLKKYGFTVKFKLVPDTEKSKSIEEAARVIKDLCGYDKKRRLFIVAFGGGVVGDLAGFVASVYKRGIAYVQVPTTLLAQVDSAIGGKTAVDLAAGKNLVGAFYQPKLVLSDISALKSLSLRQVRSGLAEVVKYGIIKEPRLFAYLEKNHRDILDMDNKMLEFIVERSSRIKAEIVRKDEREEKGIRTILNFGHTIAHALEAAGGYAGYNHGEAVALGMLAASDISSAIGILDEKTRKRIENLIRLLGLPERIKGTPLSKIIRAYYRDKKFIGAKNRFVLIEGIGKPKIAENVPLKIIRECLKKRTAS